VSLEKSRFTESEKQLGITSPVKDGVAKALEMKMDVIVCTYKSEKYLVLKR
jgi:hypothetical protein